MKSIINYFKSHRDSALLVAATVLLLAAMHRPTVPVQRDIYTYLLVVDITQSMNTRDMVVDGKPASRIEYTRRLLQDMVHGMPCGTRVSLGLFAGVSVTTLYDPIEVCANYAAIEDTIAHLEWRMAWAGNSRLRFGMLSASAVLKALPEPAQVIFFTDGEEAPRLHAFNRTDLSNWQGGDNWLLIGIGSSKPTPIPKMDEHNQVIGYWSENTYQLEPGIAQVSDEARARRDDAVATQDYERYLSKLDENYLKGLAKEIHANYVRGDSPTAVQWAIRTLKPARRDTAPLEIHWVLASLAGLLLLVAYLPRHPFKMLRHKLRKNPL